MWNFNHIAQAGEVVNTTEQVVGMHLTSNTKPFTPTAWETSRKFSRNGGATKR